MKASRYLTHVRRLASIEEGIRRFYEPLEPLVQEGRLGPVLWQLPENFHRDDARLAGWLEAVRGWPGPHAIEFRHPSWFTPPVLDALRAEGVALAIGDHPSRPWQSHEATVAVRFIRFHYGARGRSRRQLLGARARGVGAPDRGVARGCVGVRLLQQRLAGLRAGQCGRAETAPRASVEAVHQDVLVRRRRGQQVVGDADLLAAEPTLHMQRVESAQLGGRP